MNLKEAFHYQNFLEEIFSDAMRSITDDNHILKTTERHLRSNANPEAEDSEKEMEIDDFFNNDDVMILMERIIREKEMVTEAINEAKRSLDWDVDATIAANKLRQRFTGGIVYMLSCHPSKRTIQGTAYKFNNEGDQTPYHYDVEVTREEAFDRKNAKATLKSYRTVSDTASAKIDQAMVNTVVLFTPDFNVNDSFEDMMSEIVRE